MKDSASIQRVSKLHPKIRQEVIAIIDAIEMNGVEIRIVQGYRSFEEQNNIYAQGRTQAQLNLVGLNSTIARPDLPQVSKAYAGQSYHNYGLAIDFCLHHKDGTISWDLTEDLDKDGKKDWMEVVEAFGIKGYSWGGYWKSGKDNPHLEKTFGLTFQQLLSLRKSGNVDNEGYVKIVL